MPVPLPSIALSTAVTGTSGRIDVSKLALRANPRNPQDPSGFARLFLVNESGTGLDVYASLAPGNHQPIPANRQGVIVLPPGESTVIWTATYTIPQVYNEICLVYFLAEEEAIPDMGTTGGGQAGNQPRVITIALSPSFYHVRGLTLTTTAGPGQDVILDTQNFGASGVPVIAPGYFGAGTPVCFVHLYYLYARLDFPTSGSGTSVDFTLFFDVMNGSTVLATNTLYEGLLVTGNVSGNVVINSEQFSGGPGADIATGASGAGIAAATGARFRWHNNVISSTPVVHWNIGLALDITNPFTPGGHGNFTPSTGGY